MLCCWDRTTTRLFILSEKPLIYLSILNPQLYLSNIIKTLKKKIYTVVMWSLPGKNSSFTVGYGVTATWASLPYELENSCSFHFSNKQCNSEDTWCSQIFKHFLRTSIRIQYECWSSTTAGFNSKHWPQQVISLMTSDALSSVMHGHVCVSGVVRCVFGCKRKCVMMTLCSMAASDNHDITESCN